MMKIRRDMIERTRDLRMRNLTICEIRRIIREEFPGVSGRSLRVTVEVALFGSDMFSEYFANNKINIAQADVIVKIGDTAVQNIVIMALT